MIDSVSKRLVQLLAEDARQSCEALAKHLGISPTTVRRRLNKLIQSGVLRTVAVIDPLEADFSLVTIIAFDVANEKLELALQILAGRPEVKWVSTTTGRFDILVLAWFRSTDELSDFMQRELTNIEGLRNTETFICLKVKKGRYMQI